MDGWLATEIDLVGPVAPFLGQGRRRLMVRGEVMRTTIYNARLIMRRTAVARDYPLSKGWIRLSPSSPAVSLVAADNTRSRHAIYPPIVVASSYSTPDRTRRGSIKIPSPECSYEWLISGARSATSKWFTWFRTVSENVFSESSIALATFNGHRNSQHKPGRG